MKCLSVEVDGTLIDLEVERAEGVNATRAHMNLEPLPHELIFSYVGNGAPVLMRRSLGPEATEDQVQQALEFFLAYYREHMLDYTTLYPGVAKTLDTLLAAVTRMAGL